MATAGVAMLLASPRAALAHHVEIDDDASCAGWTASATYIGGDGDRKVVVDVWINDEHISETFLFDVGNLGHVASFTLYSRSGTGPLTTSGTIKMYEPGRRGGYTRLADTDYTDVALVCAAATPTSATTVTPRTTRTPVASATRRSSTATAEATVKTGGSVTPVPTSTNTPTPTPDTQIESTITPLATETGTPLAQGSTTPLATNTPERDLDDRTATSTAVATETGTPFAQGSTTPLATSTPERNRNDRTATSTAAIATPTFTDVVRGSTPPAQPPAPDEPSSGSGETPDIGAGLPNAGEGALGGMSLVMAMIGLGLVIAGAATIVGGRSVRSRK